MLLSVAAVLFATIGADAFHPWYHHGHCHLAQQPSLRADRILLGASEPRVASAVCPVCVLLATFQLDRAAQPARIVTLSPCMEKLVSFRDSCNERSPFAPLPPRSPPA